MPSPIMHAVAGYVVYHIARRIQPEGRLAKLGPLPATLVAALGLSLAPDLDFVLGFLANDPGGYHNNVSHSLFFGLLVALLAAGTAWVTRASNPGFWFALALACYWLHVGMDFATQGRGVMALWPFTAERYALPLPVFEGLHWSDGWLSPRHLRTFTQELAYGAAVLLALRLFPAAASRGTK